MNQSAIRRGIFFRHDFDEFKKSLQAGSLHLGGLLCGLAFGKKNEPVPLREIGQRLRHSVQNFRRRPLQLDDAAVNQRQRLAFRHLLRKLYIRFFERAPEAAHPIAVLPDILAFRFIKDVANVSAGIAVGLDDADEILDQLFEKYVVFPERVVRVNQQCVASHRSPRSAAFAPRTASPQPLSPALLSLTATRHFRRWPRRRRNDTFGFISRKFLRMQAALG